MISSVRRLVLLALATVAQSLGGTLTRFGRWVAVVERRKVMRAIEDHQKGRDLFT